MPHPSKKADYKSQGRERREAATDQDSLVADYCESSPAFFSHSLKTGHILHRKGLQL